MMQTVTMTASPTARRIGLRLIGPAAAALIFLVGSRFAFAQEADPAADAVRGIDTAWVLVAAFLVFFMQAGFALVEAGLTRARNASNIMMKNLMDFVTCSTKLANADCFPVENNDAALRQCLCQAWQAIKKDCYLLLGTSLRSATKEDY